MIERIIKTARVIFPVASVLFISTHVNADNYYYPAEKTYEITITNITRGVAFTPFIGASTKRNFELFELGEPASDALAAIAEGGDVSMLKDMIDEMPLSSSAVTEGLLMAGESVSFELTTNKRASYFTLASMLLPTNDNFVALNGVYLPKWGSRTYFANAYDAGSETNDELCASIPGPQCGGEPFSPEDDGEGYVYPSTGTHGDGDLSPAKYDWSGPVAKVIITRIK